MPVLVERSSSAKDAEDHEGEEFMTHLELIQRFESGAMPDGFHHADHVRLAFAYLECFPVFQALDRFSEGLKRFATSVGKPDRYHETITVAYFFLIRERMARNECANWEEFAKNNPDLLLWEDGILKRYYSGTTLNSDLARNVFLLPDASLQDAAEKLG